MAALVTGVHTGVGAFVPSGTTVNFTFRIRRLQLDKSASRLAYPFKSLSAAEARTAMGVQGAGNLLINGTGRVNQRGYVIGTATTGANQFTLDRWFVNTSGQNLTFAGTVAGMTMTAPAGGVSQVIEGANIVGGSYVLNWPGTATATVNGVARAKGEVFTLTAGANATVRFSNGTFSSATDGPQLELGTVPTPYQRLDISDELRMCQRYFEPNIRALFGGVTSAGIGNYYSVPFAVPKRAAPTMTLRAITYTGSCNSIAASNVTAAGFDVIVGNAAGGSGIADAIYSASAELTA
jgi:hypothetical protein